LRKDEILKNTKPIDHMQYIPDMEQITDTTVMEQVLECREAYDDSAYTALDVAHALQREILTPNDFASLLSPAAGDFLEQMAHRALQETRKHFGNLINLFTPLYLANHCENHCVYCGFNCYNHDHPSNGWFALRL